MRTTNDPAQANKGDRGLPPARLEGLALAEIAARARLCADILTDRAAVEVHADTGHPDRRAAATRPFLTLASQARTDGADVTLTILDLSVLAELAAAAAAAQDQAERERLPFAEAAHVVPDTMRRDRRGEFSGGLMVTGAYVNTPVAFELTHRPVIGRPRDGR